MGSTHHPRRGSMGYAPRKRARRIYASVKSRPKQKVTKIVEFAGYKAGMTHAAIISDMKGSKTEGQEISVPVTIIETPPLFCCGIRVYKKSGRSIVSAGEAWAEKHDKDLERKVAFGKGKTKFEELEKIENPFEIRLIVATKPRDAGISKKRPELFEIAVMSNDQKDALSKAKEKLGKELRVSDVFAPGDFIDTISITKGKGFQGSVKRFGVKLMNHKTEGGKVKSHRKAATLGPWVPKKTNPRVPQHGQMGFHKRTERNKRVLSIGKDPKEVMVHGDWLSYGRVRSDYVVIKGSVPGSKKRLIRLRSAIRPPGETYAGVSAIRLSLESKQGA